MKKVTRTFLSATATLGLLGLTTGTSNSASLNLNSGEVSDAAMTDTTNTIDASTHLPPGLGARTTIKRDFTVEAVGNTSGSGAGGATDRTTGTGAGEESKPSGNTDDSLGSGTGGSD